MTATYGRVTAFALALALIAGGGCRLYEVPLFGPVPRSKPATWPVAQIRGVPYYDGPEAAGRHHQLDLFLPEGRENYPVVVLIHGGVWMWGDKSSYGLYSSVGEFLAQQGIGVVLPNYRLSPAVKHPVHVQDVARAVAWTRRYITLFGGSPERLFVAGHSAGGHLAALLATDPTYLAAEGLSVADLQGVIASSGVYRIPAEGLAVTLGGTRPHGFWIDQVLPPRSGHSWSLANLALVPGIPVSVDLFRPAFDLDPLVRASASPLYQVRPGLPPFLLLVAENDLPTLEHQAAEFKDALAAQGTPVRLFRVANRNHCSVLFRATEMADPVAQALLDFLHDHGP